MCTGMINSIFFVPKLPIFHEIFHIYSHMYSYLFENDLGHQYIYYLDGIKNENLILQRLLPYHL